MTVDTDRIHRLFLNFGHTLDHLCMLIFATVAALVLNREWQLGYAELIPYATPGFVAFGLFAYPAGWLADRWSREAMITVFFLGLGSCAFACGFVQSLRFRTNTDANGCLPVRVGQFCCDLSSGRYRVAAGHAR